MYKITCEPIRTITGKKTGEFKACFGPYLERGATKEEAIKNLNDALDWYFLDLDLPIKTVQTKKRFYILERSFGGYCITGYYLGSKYTCSLMLIGRMTDYQANKELDNYINSYLEVTPDDSLITA
jgi:hypothetical protein